MSRPLIVSDCDEVLLHMVSHFRDWLNESQGVTLSLAEANGDFAKAVSWQDSGEYLTGAEVWNMLGRFFDDEMGRQTPIPGALEALEALSERADIVVLTNLDDGRRQKRAQQLQRLGLDVPVYTNQGPKGPALQAIVSEYSPSKTIFIDDLAGHMQSAAETTPQVMRLHLCGEPELAPYIRCAHQAGHAHARIDEWAKALPWLVEQLQ